MQLWLLLKFLIFCNKKSLQCPLKEKVNPHQNKKKDRPICLKKANKNTKFTLKC